MYPRIIKEHIVKNLWQGKIIILLGARQTGKTTIIKDILTNYPTNSLYQNCEDPNVRSLLQTMDPAIIVGKWGKDTKIVALDEAQTVENIGRILKLLIDTYPTIQIIATGSSSFDLANKINEPLTGRSVEFTITPLSVEELALSNYHAMDNQLLQNALRYGLYPSVVTAVDEYQKREHLGNIASNSLYKDILTFESIKKPQLLDNLLKLLALQLGGEVSLEKLANTLDVSKPTVEKYIGLLEKTFVIRRLYPLARNMRTEIRKSFKVYFLDLGMRNYLIENMNSSELRTDLGGMWENFFIIERMKFVSNHRQWSNWYYWRTYDGKEIDLIQEADGVLNCFECKWQHEPIKKATREAFLAAYPNAIFNVVSNTNYRDFLFKKG